jgi:integration host factor subunit beta
MTGKALNRSEITQRLAERLKIDMALAEDSVKLILNNMTTALAEGSRIEIRGFGSFELRHRPARSPFYSFQAWQRNAGSY